MIKILVTTDFSANSKAGIRFALQLQEQMGCELTFFHCVQVMRPSSWSDKVFKTYENNELVLLEKKLKSFVLAVARSIDKEETDFTYVVKNSFLTDSTIGLYAKTHSFQFICLSRRGEGKSNKLFGSNTTDLILNSDTPVIAVPPNYRRSAIKKILYASDLTALAAELKTIQKIAIPLKAEVEILHLCYPSDFDLNSELIEKELKKKSDPKPKYRVANADLKFPLAHNIINEVKRTRPSVLVMFTNQDQSFFEKLFFSGSSSSSARTSPVPMIIYSKLSR